MAGANVDSKDNKEYDDTLMACQNTRISYNLQITYSLDFLVSRI